MRQVTKWLLVLFAFSVPWEYSLDLGEPFGNIARVVGLLAMLAAAPAVLGQARLKAPALLHWLVLLLFLFYSASLFWSVDATATVEKIRAYFQVMGMVWLVYEFGDEPADFRNLLRGFVAGCWVLAALTFGNFSSASAVAAEQIRFVAGGQDPNDVARFLDLGLPLATLLFAVERKWWLRALALGYVPAGLLAVLLTASRGGFSGSLVALTGSAILLLVWRPRAASLLLAGLTAMAAMGWMFVPLESLDRLSTIPEQIGSGDLNDRLSIWTSGWNAFAKAPVVGYGAGAYAAASGLSPGDTAHNTLMAVLVTGGLVGLGIFLVILLEVGRAVFRTTGLLRIGLGSSVAVWLITAMVGSVEENRTTWLLFGVVGLAGWLSGEAPAVVAEMFSGGVAAHASYRGRARLPGRGFGFGLDGRRSALRQTPDEV